MFRVTVHCLVYARVQDCVGGRSIASHQSFICVSTLAAGWIDTVVHAMSATIGVVVFDARRWRKRFARGGSRRPRRPIEACGVCRNASPPATLPSSLHLFAPHCSQATQGSGQRAIDVFIKRSAPRASHTIARRRRKDAASELSIAHLALMFTSLPVTPISICFTALGWR